MSALYAAKQLPLHWVAEDEDGALVMWPAQAGGWALHSPYLGHRRALREVPDYNAAGTGWPALERERVAGGSVEARYLLKLPLELSRRVRAAASKDDISIAEWWRRAAVAALR